MIWSCLELNLDEVVPLGDPGEVEGGELEGVAEGAHRGQRHVPTLNLM